jgi:hypothetical protein
MLRTQALGIDGIVMANNAAGLDSRGVRGWEKRDGKEGPWLRR